MIKKNEKYKDVMTCREEEKFYEKNKTCSYVHSFEDC